MARSRSPQKRDSAPASPDAQVEISGDYREALQVKERYRKILVEIGLAREYGVRVKKQAGGFWAVLVGRHDGKPTPMSPAFLMLSAGENLTAAMDAAKKARNLLPRGKRAALMDGDKFADFIETNVEEQQWRTL